MTTLREHDNLIHLWSKLRQLHRKENFNMIGHDVTHDTVILISFFPCRTFTCTKVITYNSKFVDVPTITK